MLVFHTCLLLPLLLSMYFAVYCLESLLHFPSVVWSCCTASYPASFFPLMWSTRRGCVLPLSSYMCGRCIVPLFSCFGFWSGVCIVGYEQCLLQLILRCLCGHCTYFNRNWTLKNVYAKRTLLFILSRVWVTTDEVRIGPLDLLTTYRPWLQIIITQLLISALQITQH